MNSISIGQSAVRRVYWRIVPFLFLLLLVNYLDRVNIGFAALRMNQDLGLSAAAFGFGASIFFVGYALFEVPSNVFLHRFGARRWIARIMISWGLVSACMGFVQSEIGFYVLRFLLGVAEGGFLPGVIYYLAQWVPEAHRGKANSGVVSATALASVVGAPLSGWILQSFPPLLGLHSWQWMFIVEAVPAVILGIAVIFYLPDRPQDARWLDKQQRDWLVAELESEQHLSKHTSVYSIARILQIGRVWLLACLFTCLLTALYGVLLWLPQIIKHFGEHSDLEVGLLSALPFLCGGTTMLLNARHSDRHRERRWHLAIPLLIGGLALLISAWVNRETVSFLLLCIAAGGIWGGLGVFWTLTSDLLAGAAKAKAIALINTLAQVGGLVGPWMAGILRESSGGFAVPLTFLAIMAIIAAALAALVGRSSQAKRNPDVKGYQPA